MKGIIRYIVAFTVVVSTTLVSRQLPAQQAGPLLFGQHQDKGVDRYGLTRPPGPFTGITLTSDQVNQVRLLDRRFGEAFVAQNNRTRQAGGDLRGEANRQAIQAAHVQLLSDIRQILTPEQQLIFDRNQFARNAYLAQRKAIANKEQHVAP